MQEDVTDGFYRSDMIRLTTLKFSLASSRMDYRRQELKLADMGSCRLVQARGKVGLDQTGSTENGEKGSDLRYVLVVG